VSFDSAFCDRACGGLLSCADAGAIKGSTSTIAKDDILIITDTRTEWINLAPGASRRRGGPGSEKAHQDLASSW
jgi:hypothetical protein